MSIATGFGFEEVYVELAHNIDGFARGNVSNNVSFAHLFEIVPLGEFY